MNSTTAKDVVRCAREYVGTPFFHAGRSKEHGVDCIGLPICVAHELGLMTYDNHNYTSTYVDPDHLKAEIARFCSPICGDLQEGDLLLFEIAGNAQHVAVYTEDDTIIHAYQSAGKVVEHPLDHHWRKRLVASFRWREPWLQLF